MNNSQVRFGALPLSSVPSTSVDVVASQCFLYVGLIFFVLDNVNTCYMYNSI